jgi:hypothetical protein
LFNKVPLDAAVLTSNVLNVADIVRISSRSLLIPNLLHLAALTHPCASLHSGFLPMRTVGIAHLILGRRSGHVEHRHLGNCVTTWHGGESYR